MKILGRYLTVFCLILVIIIELLGWTPASHAQGINLPSIKILAATTESPIKLCTESNVKIDLNNANINAFTDCPGFYPNLARLIISNSPYQKVEDVLKLSDLSDRQKDLLKANLGNFEIGEARVPLEQRMPPRPSMR